MTHLAALALGCLVGAVAAVVYLSGDRQAAIADRDSALDALRKAEAARLYAERSLDYWLEKAAR